MQPLSAIIVSLSKCRATRKWRTSYVTSIQRPGRWQSRMNFSIHCI